jgi:hypothetical protein
MEQFAAQLQQQSQQLQHQLDQQSHQLADLNQRLQHETQAREHSQQQLQQAQALQQVRVPKPPETDGRKPTPRHFAEAFEVFMAQRGVDLNTQQACQIAATFLRDAALDWYVSYQQQVAAGAVQQFGSWQQMKQAFQERFQPYDMQEEALKGLDRLVQLRSVAEYTTRFTELMLQLPGMLETMRIHYYCAGLKHAIAVQVRMQQPHTLAAAMTAAMAADSIVFGSGTAVFGPYGSSSGSSYRGAPFRNSKPFGGSSSGGSSSAPMELGSLRQQQQQQRGSAQQQQPAPSPSSGSVPYCSWHKRQGHWTRDCRKRASALRSQHAGGSAGKQ